MFRKDRNINKIGLLLALLILVTLEMQAQSTVIRGKVTSRNNKETLIGVNVSEIDKTNRVLGGAVTNLDGNFVMSVKNTENKIVFSYLGFTKQTMNIGAKTNFNVNLEESSNELNSVEIKAKKTTNTGTMPIPTREISTAVQKIDAKEFEGLQVGSVDEALQGRVAGLDIVSNSGAPGSGMSIRIRGTTSITGSSQPLIVVNGIPYESNQSSTFDFSTAKEEQYADLLNINPDDILDIVVLKDAASTAIWGSKGANGVLMITTKKGKIGKPRVEISYRYSSGIQPKPIPMLNGDDYTMLMKDAYLNPKLDNSTGNIPELNYDPTYSQFWNYNNNTDWVKSVKQTGVSKDLYISLSGGQERGTYRITFGHLNETGTGIGQSLERFSNRTYLSYNLSDRLVFSTDFSYTYIDNDKNYDDLLGIAYKMMPNVPIYRRDAAGNYSTDYFNIDRKNSNLNAAQLDLTNPIALANLGKYKEKTYRLTPTFNIQYDLIDPTKQTLRYFMYISFDVNNKRTFRFLPKEVSGSNYSSTFINSAFNADEDGINIEMQHNLTWIPKMPANHSLMFLGRIQTSLSTYGNSSFGSYWGPSSNIQSVASNTFIGETKSSSGNGHSYSLMGTSHYSYKERYIFDFTLNRNGSSRFGKSNRIGYFPGVSGKWIISDEPFMKKINFISMLAIRPSWGFTGNQPDKEGLQYSRYSTYNESYINMPAVYPSSLQIDNLRWEKSTQYNLGADIGLFDSRLNLDLNIYYKHTTDLLFPSIGIPNTSGFTAIDYVNGGVMDNNGWEINFTAPSVIKIGQFMVDMSLNFSNNVNIIQELSKEIVLVKGDMSKNGEYLRNIIMGNPLGSFYGYKYKGVYQYNTYLKGTQESAPIARDPKGDPILDKYGKPKPMYFNYGQSNAYLFKGGDAIYEDINHDGSIDANDVVYLGNANPLFNGGFGMTFHYKNLSVNAFFNFHYGNMIVNQARMEAENMYSNNNQSIAVNWRWRKEGDVTNMPRALYQAGYNWLGSDRYVEDGSFARWKYLTLNYSVSKKFLKQIKLSDLKFYLTANNLMLFTNYSGVDPEVGYAADKGDPFKIGFDGSKTPRSIDYTIGITLGF